MFKYNNAYKTIGEVVKILNLKSKNNRSSPTQLHGGATDFTGNLSACYGRALFNTRPL